MARKKISARQSAGTLTGEEIVPVVRLNVVDPNLITTAQDIADLAEFPITTLTVEDAQILATDAGFTPGALYLVSDAGVSDLGFLCAAVSDSGLSSGGNAGFYVPDFQAIGDYSGVSGFGQQQGVWIGANEGDYSEGDVVIWNGRHYKYSGGGDGATTPETGNYELLAKSATNGYIVDWDAAKYDLGNNWIWYRKCKRGNLWEQSYAGYDTVGFPMLNFQWGNNLVYDNSIVNGQIPCLNQTGSIYQNVTNGEASFDLSDNAGDVFWNVILNEAAFYCSGNTGEIRSNNIQGGIGLVSAVNNSGLIRFNFVHGVQMSFDDNSGEIIGNNYINGGQTAFVNSNTGHFNYNTVIAGGTTGLTNNQANITNNTIQNGGALNGDSNAGNYTGNTISAGIAVDLTDNVDEIIGTTVIANRLKKATDNFTLNPEGEVTVTDQGSAGIIQVTLGAIREATRYSFFVYQNGIQIYTRPGDTIILWNGAATQTIDTGFNGTFLQLGAPGMSAQVQKVDSTVWAVMYNNGGFITD